MALWVEKNHGTKGNQFIADRIARLRSRGEEDGAALWEDVARRFERLSERHGGEH